MAKTSPERIEYIKAWRKANRARVNERARRYRAKNHDRIRQYENRRRRLAYDPEAAKRANLKFRAAHPGYSAKKQKARRLRDPDHVRSLENKNAMKHREARRIAAAKRSRELAEIRSLGWTTAA